MSELKKALKLAALNEELKAYDAEETEEAMRNFKSIGLSEKDAKQICSALREKYIKAKLEEDDEDIDEEDVEIEEEDAEEKDKEKSKAKDKDKDEEDEKTLAEIFGLGDIEDIIEKLDKEKSNKKERNMKKKSADNYNDNVMFKDEPDNLEQEDAVQFQGTPSEEEPELELEEGEEINIKLPHGLNLEIEVEGEEEEEEIENKSTRPSAIPEPGLDITQNTGEGNMKDILSARRKSRERLLRSAAQKLPYHIPPTPLYEEAPKMKETYKGVDIGEQFNLMQLEGDEDNSLYMDPDFNKNILYTSTDEDYITNSDLRDIRQFSDFEGPDIDESFLATPDFAKNRVPTSGLGGKDMFGDEKPGKVFELPTQLPQTSSRRTITSQTVYDDEEENVCDWCKKKLDDGDNFALCNQCGKVFLACDECLEQDKCPNCDGILDSRYEQELDDSFEIIDIDELDSLDQEEEVNEPKIISKLRRENKQLRLSMAKMKKAAATAAYLACIGDINVNDVEVKIEEFMKSDISAAGLETIKKIAENMHSKRATKVAGKVQRSDNVGISFNPNPTQTSVNDLTEALKSLFIENLNLPKEGEI